MRLFIKILMGLVSALIITIMVVISPNPFISNNIDNRVVYAFTDVITSWNNGKYTEAVVSNHALVKVSSINRSGMIVNVGDIDNTLNKSTCEDLIIQGGYETFTLYTYTYNRFKEYQFDKDLGRDLNNAKLSCDNGIWFVFVVGKNNNF